jgi:Ser/Thr protein kinase RdoA (MazF antagonist)
MSEAPLSGGRVTPGVVRVGGTVRRPPKANVALVRGVLALLAELGLDVAPRYLGSDEQGRETFSYLEGEVPDELDAGFSDATLASAARLIRRYHDATAGSTLADGCEIVCHNDLSPCNFVFRAGVPVGIIDFDNAAPGARLDDLGYALFLWLNIGSDSPAAAKQARRIKIFCDAYGVPAGAEIVDAIAAAVAGNIEHLRADGRLADVEWWQAQLDWVEQHRAELVVADWVEVFDR